MSFQPTALRRRLIRNQIGNRAFCSLSYNHGWRWVFSSYRLAKLSAAPLAWLERAGGGFFALLFPADCRLCAKRLTNLSSVPVCPDCLAAEPAMLPEHFCVLCRTPFLNARPLDESGVCRLCRSGATRFDAAYGFGDYRGRLRDLIHVFKYGKVRGLAGPLGHMMAVAFPRDQQFDMIVPMPMHWRKRLVRGFNQSELLARVLSRRTAIPVARALAKPLHTPAQAGLSRAQRRQNVSRAFRTQDPTSIRGKRILLIDDVFTTGATANAAAAALKDAGALRVSIYALARADRRGGYSLDGDGSGVPLEFESVPGGGGE